ncbi:hypothetical protein RV12_GL000027 [Enterococcus quebecensis]|nr:hypothetical protein RV12_GL000027 [Enterococcus quebecensis]
MAKPEIKVKQQFKQLKDKDSEVSIEKSGKVVEKNKQLVKVLEPVENAEGLKAIPKILTMKQNEKFPDLNNEADLTKLFSERIIPHPEQGALYAYVNADGSPAKTSAERIGFQTIYVEITERYNLTSIRVPIPVTVKDSDTSLLLDNQVALQTDNISGKIILYPAETANKTQEQIQQLVKMKSNARAWTTEDGTEVPVNVIKTTISGTSVGAYKADFEVSLESGGELQKASVQKDVIVFGADPQSFVAVAQNAILSLGTNPTNLFTKFQALYYADATDANYQFVNENGKVLEQFDTSTAGFHWAYVKMTDKKNESVTTTLKVPINVTNKDTTSLLTNKVMIKSNTEVVLYPDETKGKNTSELLTLIQSKSDSSAWDMSTGEELSVSFTETTAANNSVGEYRATIEVNLDGASATTTRTVIVFGAELKSPYYFKVGLNKELAMGTNAGNIFSKYQSFSDNDATSSTYEWVKNQAGDPTEPFDTFDTSKLGFNWGYIKMTDKRNQIISTVIPIPITVISDDKTADNQTVILNSKVGMSFNSLRFLNVSEVKGKTNGQIIQLLTQKIEAKAWEVTSGKMLETRVTKTTIINSSRGLKKVTLAATLGNQVLNYTLDTSVLPDQIFENESMSGWQDVRLNSNDGFITNPLNQSKIGFPSRGLSTNDLKSELGFIVKDKGDRGYVHSGNVTDIPGVNNGVLYGGAWDRINGIGRNDIISNFSSKYFLRKEKKLKEILIDEKNQIIFVYNLSLHRNLNFSVKLDMYNVSNQTKSFSMLESVDTNYYDDYVTIYSLGNNSGFYMQPKQENKFSIKLKDSRGNWLSEYRKYMVGNYNLIGVQNGRNYFTNSFAALGFEKKNYAEGTVLASGVDSAYQLGASWKSIAPDKAFKTGYEVFAGEEIPYMQLKADPEVFNVYNDYMDDAKTNIKLSKIVTESVQGTIYVTYPNGEEGTMPFTSNQQKEFKGILSISRNKLPEKLNEELGTIREYDLPVIAITESKGAYEGLPSQDYVLKLNVYNLGAKAVPQIVKKGATFNKKASDVLEDVVILPGHTASYEYEGEMPDTSTTGLKSVMVRMTDKNEQDKSVLIKIPVQVIDGTVPSTGLYIAANNFKSRPDPFQNLTTSEINQLILEKSEAVAWDVAAGSSKGVDLSVESTTLTSNPVQGNYKATLKAIKGSVILRKTITIVIQSNQKVNVTFVDEIGEALHDPITFDKIIGTTIDLTEEKEVQQVFQSILDKNYQLVKKPENETKIPVTSEESTVQYQFKGMLFVQSSPKFLNFGRKTLGIPFIKVEKAKYDKPLIVWDNRKSTSAWNLTATLKKPLTSQEDPSKILPSAIRYKISDSETVVLSENVSQSVAERTHDTKGQYNVSNEWDKNESGLILEVPSGEVLQPGGYRATILWQVEQTP